jgi:transcriptional pleiotropic regulator of transition state genes
LKATGIVRKIDELGRIVLPIEFRQSMELEPKDGVELYMEGKNLMIKKHEPACTFCNGTEDLKLFQNKLVCKTCRDRISKM